MRASLAAGLALFLVLSAAAPHVHVGPGGADTCLVCVARQGDAVRSEVPDLAPVAFVTPAPQLEPEGSPASGAPLGAIPGQSPPQVA